MENFHFAELITHQAKKYGDRIALLHRKNTTDNWNEISWNAFSKNTDSLARAFYEIGVKPGDRIGQFSGNMAENLLIDYALFSNRAVVVPMYATSTASQISFIVSDATIEILVVGDQVQYDVACEVFAETGILKKIIVLEDEVQFRDNVPSLYYKDFILHGEKSSLHFEISKRRDKATEDDLACILYTSGTTGNPKGVMLKHSNLLEAVRIHKLRIPTMSDKDTSIAFLPLTHVFERMWCYLCMSVGVTVYVNFRPIEVNQTLKHVRPTLMCAVPRFWEKVYAAVQDNISKMTPFKQGIVTWALATGKKYNIDTLRMGKTPSLSLKIKYNIADKLIYSKVKKAVGIENAQLFPVAGAKLSDDINIFMRSMGVPIVYGYGLTESTASVSFFDYEHYEFGTVGKIIPDLQVRIGENNEIELKGKTIFHGYYNNPKATAEVFTEDGFFKTGDAGYIRNDAIILTDRIKDLFKTSYGKYIAPQEIETRLVLDNYIEQAAAVGDEKPYVTAIIAPSMPHVEEYAKKNNIAYSSHDELLANPKIYALIEERIKVMQAGMAPHELVKKFVMISKPFSIQSGELTNTLKLKRAIVMQRYKVQIDEMYV